MIVSVAARAADRECTCVIVTCGSNCGDFHGIINLFSGRNRFGRLEWRMPAKMNRHGQTPKQHDWKIVNLAATSEQFRADNAVKANTFAPLCKRNEFENVSNAHSICLHSISFEFIRLPFKSHWNAVSATRSFTVIRIMRSHVYFIFSLFRF